MKTTVADIAHIVDALKSTNGRELLALNIYNTVQNAYAALEEFKELIRAGFGQWNAISGAPKNGKPLLCVAGDLGRRIILFWDGAFWVEYEGGPVYEPTHWMPLPLPPKET